MSKKPQEWPRLRDLPTAERARFEHWLRGQTCPVIEGVPDDDQDAYYQWDYDRWKARQPANP